MNSMSRGYYDPCRRDECQKKPYRAEEDRCPTIVKCGCPSSTTLPVGSTVGTQFTLASLTLDTSCMCEPNIKLDFTSNFVATAVFTGALNIQVFKHCKGDMVSRPVGPVWNFNSVALLQSTTFSFFICDSDTCDEGCCTYNVVATVAVVTVGTLSINNATLAATVTCKNSCQKCRKDSYY